MNKDVLRALADLDRLSNAAVTAWEDAAQMRERHVQHWHSPSDEAWGRQGFCAQDGSPWPCDAARLLTLVDSLQAVRDV